MIKIKTMFKDEIATFNKWKTGPINLLRAVDEIAAHREHMDACHGEGSTWSWLEINGIKLDSYDEPDLRFDDKEMGNNVNVMSRFQKAKKFLANNCELT